MIFDKRQSNIAKGIAALLLLWHHVFYNNERIINSITPLINTSGTPIVCFFSIFAKVCVAIFCVLTGYGLFKSFSSFADRNRINGKFKLTKQFVFVKNHFLNLMSKYWFVYIIFGLLGIAIGASRFTLYEGSILSGIIDFLGLASLFGTPTLNATWWFMYMIIIFYILFPIVYKLFSYSPELVLILSLFLLILPPISFVGELQKYQSCFIIGMYISNYNLLERISVKLGSTPKRFSVCIVGLLTTAYFRFDMFNSNKYDAFFAVIIILTSFTILSRIPILNRALEEIGKYSALIFMSHTFIYAYYFRNFIYWFKYPPLIFVVLTAISFGVAKLLDWIMKITRYNKLFELLTREKKKS